MKGKRAQEGVKIAQGGETKERKIPLILYKTEERYKISPPQTVKIFWFWTPEPPSSLEESGAIKEIEGRLKDFCREEGKQVRATLFSGVKNRYEESLIMVTVQFEEFFSEQEKRRLMINAPEPPRIYPPLSDEAD